MTSEARLLIGGKWRAGYRTHAVADKYTGDPVTTVHVASPAQVHDAVAEVAVAQKRIEWPAFERFTALSSASRLVAARADSLADSIVTDTGFTLADARGEVRRAEQTLLLSAEAAKQLAGEMVPLEAAPGVTGRLGFTLRFPIGVVAAITPFNSPLNTVAHKVGPALAAGNGVVLKPANATPLTAGMLGEILLDAGVPAELLAILHGRGGTVGQALLADERIGFYAFTGSTEVGRKVRAMAGLRRTQLELGSISSTIVCRDADPAEVAAKVIPAAFRKAGQVCTSVQRLYVHHAVFAPLIEALIGELAGAVAGDPRQPGTFVGPLISRAEAERVHSWITAARQAGARAVTGGNRAGSVVEPTILAGVLDAMDVVSREIFGPVVSLMPFTDLAEAVTRANGTEYGLAAGLFTRDLDQAMWAAKRLRFGGVHINETSSSRVDLMPYWGVKNSGHGREGPAYAAREMTEERLVTITYHDRPG